MEGSDVSRRNLWQGGCAMVAGLSSRQVSGPAYVPAGLSPEGDNPASDGGRADPGDIGPPEAEVPWDDNAELIPPDAQNITGKLLNLQMLNSCVTPSENFCRVKHHRVLQSCCHVGDRRRQRQRAVKPVAGRHRLSRTTLSLVFGAVFAVLTITSGPVHASQPVREAFDVDSSFVVDDLCDFPIMVDAHFEGTNVFYVDHSDTLRRISVHVREQDTFSANGTVLVGLPFRFNQEILFDENGVVEHAYASGVVEWVPLPDGTIYHAAGRIDFVLHGTNYVIVPGLGHTGRRGPLLRRVSMTPQSTI